MKKHISLCCFLLMLSTLSAHTHEQTPDVDSQMFVIHADSTTSMDKIFNIEYSYSYQSDRDAILLESIADIIGIGYDIVKGPLISTSAQALIINGSTQISRMQTFTYQLTFDKAGTYTLPPLVAKTESEIVITSEPFTVHVTGNKKVKIPGRRQIDADTATIEINLNKDTVSLGDSLICDVKMFCKLPVNSISIPKVETDNAFCKSLSIHKKNIEKVNYKGSDYDMYLLNRYIIYPMQPGTQKIRTSPVDVDMITKSTDDAGHPTTNRIMGTLSSECKEFVVTKREQDLETGHLPTVSHPIPETGIVLDCSGSFNYKDDPASVSFLQTGLNILHAVLDDSNKADFDLTTFAETPCYWSNLTKIDKANDILEDGPESTALYNAILASVFRFGTPSENQPRSILLLTDGKENSSSITEETLINILLANKIKVDVVAIGSDKPLLFYKSPYTGRYARLKNTQDFETLRKIAEKTNGTFIYIKNGQPTDQDIEKIKEAIKNRQRPATPADERFIPDGDIFNFLYKKIISETVKTIR